MNPRDWFRMATLLVIGVSFFFGPTDLVDAQPKAVKALKVASAGDAANPTGAIWKKAPALTVSLLPAPPVHAAVSGVPITSKVVVQAVRTADLLFIRLSWQDKTENRRLDQPGGFLDGVAVQFPLDGKPATAILMGNPGGRVNIWYWKPGDQVENLFADGFGTLTRAPVQDVSGKGVYAKGAWTVVLSRNLRTAAEDGVQLDGARDIPLALAVWNGSNRERDGFKAVTMEWLALKL